MSTDASYTWEDAARDLALETRLTYTETNRLIEPLRDSPLQPFAATSLLRSLIDATAAGGFDAAVVGVVLGGVAQSGVPPKPYMKPGTKVTARRFGKDLLAEVTASSGSTFTVAAVDEGDYTVWQDMTFADVTILEESFKIV